MSDIPWDLLGWVAVAVAVAVYLWHRTNGDTDSRTGRQTELERRLARYPASAGAIVIKAQRRRALKRMLPAILLAAPLVLAAQFVPTHTAMAWLCDQIGAEQAVRWLLRMFFPGLPLLLAVAAAFGMVSALRILRGGYAPPLDAVVLHDTIAVNGWRAKLQAWATLTVMPLMVVVLFHVTHGFVQTFDTEANWQTLGAARCPKFFPGKAGSP